MERHRAEVNLNQGHIRYLPRDEIIIILRAADNIAHKGGRNLLARILKGSKEKKILRHGLDQCSAYGYYSDLTIQEISYRIDWMILNGYLHIVYCRQLPLIVISEHSWLMVRETVAEDLFKQLADHLDEEDNLVVKSLAGRNRGLVQTLIDLIAQRGNSKYIPALIAWKNIEGKRIQTKLQKIIESFSPCELC